MQKLTSIGTFSCTTTVFCPKILPSLLRASLDPEVADGSQRTHCVPSRPDLRVTRGTGTPGATGSPPRPRSCLLGRIPEPSFPTRTRPRVEPLSRRRYPAPTRLDVFAHTPNPVGNLSVASGRLSTPHPLTVGSDGKVSSPRVTVGKRRSNERPLGVGPTTGSVGLTSLLLQATARSTHASQTVDGVTRKPTPRNTHRLFPVNWDLGKEVLSLPGHDTRTDVLGLELGRHTHTDPTSVPSVEMGTRTVLELESRRPVTLPPLQPTTRGTVSSRTVSVFDPRRRLL